MALKGFRKEYSEVRSDLTYETGCKPAEFDAAVKALLPENATPEQWAKTARVAKVMCGRCAGTGQYITMVENNIPKGPGGICFRCRGKGKQDHADTKRNAYYDEHRIIMLSD